MIYWIRRGGRLFGLTAFFTILFAMLAKSGAPTFEYGLIAFVNALFAGMIGWLLGAVVCDILIKGILADLGDGGVDRLVEGGFLQRLQMMNERLVPGGADMPFTKITPVKSDERVKRKK